MRDVEGEQSWSSIVDQLALLTLLDRFSVRALHLDRFSTNWSFWVPRSGRCELPTLSSSCRLCGGSKLTRAPYACRARQSNTQSHVDRKAVRPLMSQGPTVSHLDHWKPDVLPMLKPLVDGDRFAVHWPSAPSAATSPLSLAAPAAAVDRGADRPAARDTSQAFRTSQAEAAVDCQSRRLHPGSARPGRAGKDAPQAGQARLWFLEHRHEL